MSKKVYMDHAATTYVAPEVLDTILPIFRDAFGNPSSLHSFGNEAKALIDVSRETIANAIGAKSNEIYFTAGGTESDNWIIKGIAEANINKGNHIITTKIEHHALLHSCEYLEANGFDITYLSVDSEGMINLDELKAAITDKTILISIMYANNEIGTIEPITEIGKIAKEHNIYFHTDAVQAVGHVKINVKDENIDMLSLSGHKIYAPKGIGVAYIKQGTKISNLIEGGGQERKKRGGTENVPGIVGLAKAIDLAVNEMDAENARLIAMRERLINGILEKVPYTRVNGHRTKRLPGNVSFCFEFVEGEGLLLMLDMLGIAGSSGSACASGSLDPSHVLLAIGLPHEIAHGSLRLSLGSANTEEDIDYVLEHLPVIVQKLRNMSPLYDNKIKGGK